MIIPTDAFMISIASAALSEGLRCRDWRPDGCAEIRAEGSSAISDKTDSQVVTHPAHVVALRPAAASYFCEHRQRAQHQCAPSNSAGSVRIATLRDRNARTITQVLFLAISVPAVANQHNLSTSA